MDLSNSKTDVTQNSHSAVGRSGSAKPIDNQPSRSNEIFGSEIAEISNANDEGAAAALDESSSSEPEATKAKSETVSRLTAEQVAFRQKKKNDYATNELEGWPLHQLFVDYPQLFLGIATVSVFVFLLILQVHFIITLLVAITTPFGVVKLWRANPKALLITVYSFAAVILLASAVLIYSVANAEEAARRF